MPSPFSILQGVGFVVLGYVLAKLVMGVLPFGQPQYLRFELQPLGAKAPNRIVESTWTPTGIGRRGCGAGRCARAVDEGSWEVVAVMSGAPCWCGD